MLHGCVLDNVIIRSVILLARPGVAGMSGFLAAFPEARVFPSFNIESLAGAHDGFLTVRRANHAQREPRHTECRYATTPPRNICTESATSSMPIRRSRAVSTLSPSQRNSQVEDSRIAAVASQAANSAIPHCAVRPGCEFVSSSSAAIA